MRSRRKLRGPSAHHPEVLPSASVCAPAYAAPAILRPAGEGSSGRPGAPEPPVGHRPYPSILPPRHWYGVATALQLALQTPWRPNSNLLRHAHAAYVAQDFANALNLVAEQARQFPNGALAEEREALRVRSLAAAGRAGEAQRAAADFAEHFPRSVLLTQIQKFIATD